jgi:hypothetical protein
MQQIRKILIANRGEIAGSTNSWSTPLIRPSGTFSRREKGLSAKSSLMRWEVAHDFNWNVDDEFLSLWERMSRSDR